jgi:hypothetical protein
MHYRGDRLVFFVREGELATIFANYKKGKQPPY